MVKALVTMVEPELSLLQVPVKRVPWHAVELHHPALGIAPKTLDAIDMNVASGKFISAMVDSQVFVKADIDQSVVAPPAVSVDDTGNIGFASDDRLQDDF